jgi:hypothetical protein
MPDIPVNTAALRMIAMAATQGTRTAYEKKAYDEWRVLLKIPGQVQKVELFPGGCPTDLAREDCEYIAATQPSVLLALLDELDGLRAAALARPKSRAPRKPKAAADPLAEYFDAVDPDVVRDFKAHRQRIKAEITATVMKGFQREATKAGMTLEAALVICCERGWRFVKADWLERERTQAGQQQVGARPGRFDPVAHVNKGGMPPPGEWPDGIIDITPR